MNKKIFALLIILVLSAFVLSGCGSLPMYFSTYSVQGTVTDSSGDPVENATITFSNGDTPVQTNSNGKWYKTGLGGTVVIEASKSGLTFTPTDYTVESEKNNVNFQSNENIIDLAGNVTDGTSGIENVSIRFDNGADAASTDANGDWSKNGLIIEESVKVTPQHTGYTFTPESSILSGSDSNVDFEGTAK